MKILNTMCRLGNQRNLLEHYPKRQVAITPHILCISLLALLTGCTLEIKPDKTPGGTTGNNRIPPPYPGQVYPPPYQGPFTSTDGGYTGSVNPVGNPSSNRDSTRGSGFSIKITSR